MLAAFLIVLAMIYVVFSYLFMLFYYQCIYDCDGWDADYFTVGMGVLFSPISLVILIGMIVFDKGADLIERLGRKIIHYDDEEGKK